MSTPRFRTLEDFAIPGRFICLTLDSIAVEALDFVLHVEQFYASFLASQASDVIAEHGLGGKLLYAGQFGPSERALLVAGNIAGAASLAVSADETVQRQGIRDGVADFLVNSLDEALRILKNEIRKRETVSVCIAADPLAIENEMLERGVVPDLLAPGFAGNAAFAPVAPRLAIQDADPASALVCWGVESAPARWLPKLDAIAMDCLEAVSDTQAPRRWLRLAPRYLGRLAQNFRVLRCSPDVADAIKSAALAAAAQGEIGAVFQIQITRSRLSVEAGD